MPRFRGWKQPINGQHRKTPVCRPHGTADRGSEECWLLDCNSTYGQWILRQSYKNCADIVKFLCIFFQLIFTALQIQYCCRAFHLIPTLLREVGIYLSRFDARMAQHFLNITQVHPFFAQMRGKRRPQRVHSAIKVDVRWMEFSNVRKKCCARRLTAAFRDKIERKRTVVILFNKKATKGGKSWACI